MTLVMEENELLDPVYVGLFSAVAIMTSTDQSPYFIEEFGHREAPM